MSKVTKTLPTAAEVKVKLQATLRFLISLENKRVSYFVLVSKADDYCVSEEKGKAQVGISLNARPFLFNTKAKAEVVAKDFKARNGNGPIEWEVITASEFVKRRKRAVGRQIIMFSQLAKIEEEEAAN